MNNTIYFSRMGNTAKHLLRWAMLILPVSVVTGLTTAFFLWLLEVVTNIRWQHMWLIFFLPLVGVAIYFIYKNFGGRSIAGNNLVIDEIHQPGGGVPASMAPLILFTTVATHLFGGSAGREGTAVQMGGSIASQFTKWFTLNTGDKQLLLMCGVSAGFAAVFGTPVAAAVFAIEVLYIGAIKYNAFIPCLIAGIIAHITCIATGIHHTRYVVAYTASSIFHFPFIAFNFLSLIKVIIAGALFGFVARVFSQTTHYIKQKTGQLITVKWLVPVIGGVLIIGISYLLGNFDYLGLGVSNPKAGGVSIVTAFTKGGATNFSWFWKLLLTAITLGMGFKGGEVTPLFFIGATLGNVLATLGGTPTDLMAGLGFIAVFAGAANTPLACTLMGVELFGGQHIIYYAAACFMAYYCSGHQGIYNAQKVGTPKFFTKIR